jgi:hypothetical protein
MKKIVFSILMIGFALTASAQFKGNIEVYKMDGLTVHSYVSSEAMADVSFIIEGKDALVVLEQQSFHLSMKDFKDYMATLNKPVVKVVANYHTGGLADWEASKVVMIEGMPEFEKGEIYSGMLGHFSKIFAGAMDLRPHGEVATVGFNTTHKWAGIDFKFLHGAKSDFPAASINIADKVYYTHFAPAIAHMSGEQISNAAAIDATIEELSNAKISGCRLFIGSHGNPARIEDVDFQLQYLTKMKETLKATKNKDRFVEIMSQSFIGIPGISNLKTVADKLYK